ncbi:hypothetical protein SEUCBS139899_001877 [Sporothrix eucalyptigena]|uniref:Major facilitator superfamily (MFS) profile domain-containing protein n=1 Tax=Sporothrix eucalyptigena TaxID=1812306 RepID=A0ABP0BZY4_9PEZI
MPASTADKAKKGLVTETARGQANGQGNVRELPEEEDTFALASDSDGDVSDTNDEMRIHTPEKDEVDDDIDDDAPSERQGLVDRSVEVVANDGRPLAENTALVEPDLDVRTALRVYRKAVFWCLVTSACVIMEGYDMILIGNFFAFPPFAAKYGQFVDDAGQHQLSPAWMAALSNAAPLGCFVGTWFNGPLVARFGHKRVLLAALGTLSGTIFLTFFAPTITVLLIGELLCGLPWGIFASSAPAYASELLPTALRSYLTSWTNMCFIVGQLISAAVLAILVDTRHDEWAFRIPFGLQWLWPVLIVPILVFAPESPWHLVRTGRRAAARQSLRRLQSPAAAVAAGVSVEATLATIERTNNLEVAEASHHQHHSSQGGGDDATYWDCFRGTELRRTEIACMAFAAQVLAGAPFAYNSTYFFQQVGLATHTTYLLNTGGTLLALAGTLVNWFALMPRYGRRPIFVGGMAVMTSLLATVGFLGLVPESRAIGLVQASLTLAWTLAFQLSVGQLGWALPAEVGSTRLRQRTVCLARNAYYLSSLLANVAQPYLLNPGALDLKGTVGFVWAVLAGLVLVWAIFRLPETKGRSYEALDWLFAQRTPTWKFATAKVPIGAGTAVEEGGVAAVHRNDEGDSHEMERLVQNS